MLDSYVPYEKYGTRADLLIIHIFNYFISDCPNHSSSAAAATPSTATAAAAHSPATATPTEYRFTGSNDAVNADTDPCDATITNVTSVTIVTRITNIPNATESGSNSDR